ncbi:MAG: OmpA family protein [Paludibacteraceae bacterium]|nr:OmpA family protein [Paludibacteraceae bacterium]
MKNILRTLLVIGLLVGFSATTITTVNAAEKKEMTAAQKQKAKEKAKKQKEREKAAAKRAKEQAKAKAQREKATAQRQKEAAKTAAERAKVQEERERVASQRVAEQAKAEAARQAQEEKELAALRTPQVEEETKERPEVISYFNLAPRIGYDAMFDDLSALGKVAPDQIEPNTFLDKKVVGGAGGGLTFSYELECGHFRFETGLGFDIYNARTDYSFLQTRTLPRYNQEYYYLTDKLRETRTLGYVSLPVMFGAQFSRYYFMVGARVGYGLFGSYKQKGLYDVDVYDPAFINTYGMGIIDAPKTAAQIEGTLPTDNGKIHLQQPAVSACFEFGVDLDEWLQKAPDEKKKVKVKPGERLPFGREHIHYKASLFAEYEFLNIYSTNDAYHNNYPLVFEQNNWKPYSTNSTLAVGASSALNNLLIGAKFTVQFEVPGKTPRQVPPQPSYLDLKVENEANGEKLPATLEIVNTKTGKVVLKPMQMKNGQKAQKLAKGNYEIRLAMQDFYPATATFTIPSDGYLLDTTLQLRHRPIFNVRVRNAETGMPLPAKVQVLRQGTANELMALNTDTANGAASTMLQDTILYALHIDMVGYEPYDGVVTNIGDNMLVDMIPIKKGEVFILKNMFFATNKTKILPMSEPTLAELFGFLDRNPEVRIKIMGHTDSVGKDQANQILSEGRANAVRQELIERGIAADRIEAEGYGETRPIDTNDTDEGRQNNRRVEVEIL